MLQVSYLDGAEWRALFLPEGTMIRVLRWSDKDARPIGFQLWVNNRPIATSTEPVVYGDESEFPINDPFVVGGLAPEPGLLQATHIPAAINLPPPPEAEDSSPSWLGWLWR
jgi:hypothetical protein